MKIMDSGSARVKDGSIFYESKGKGLPLVLIHAGYLDRRMWDSQFERFSEKHRVIRYDIRGFGKTSNPQEKYSDSDDLKELLDHLGIDSAVLLGVSNGGRISLDFAVEHPDRVRGLILMDFGVSGYKGVSPEEDHIWDSFTALEERYMNLMKEKRFREAAAIDVDMWTSQVSHETREILLDMAAENAAKSAEYAPDLQVSPAPPAFERLDSLRMPILMILGDRDLPGTIMQVKHVHDLLPDSELKVISGADHIPSLSKPEEFDGMVLDFLERIGKM